MSVQLTIHARTDVGPDEAFRRLADYERYAEHTDTVRHVEVTLRDQMMFSTWQVNFRGGMLCWTERDQIDPVRRVLEFEQVDGDLDRFVGRWEVAADSAGSTMTFTADLDMGIPSLAPIIDPVARQALDTNLHAILRGLFADAQLDIGGVGLTRAGS